MASEIEKLMADLRNLAGQEKVEADAAKQKKKPPSGVRIGDYVEGLYENQRYRGTVSRVRADSETLSSFEVTVELDPTARNADINVDASEGSWGLEEVTRVMRRNVNYKKQRPVAEYVPLPVYAVDHGMTTDEVRGLIAKGKLKSLPIGDFEMVVVPMRTRHPK